MDFDRLRRFLDDADATVGRYEIVREVGRGGAGVVFEANDPQLKRRVAIKRGALARREAEAAAKLRHPNIIAVHEVGPDWIAMDFIAGPTFAAAREGMTLRDRLIVLEQVARAAGHAHAAGVIHRDIKASNVLLDGGRPLLADFGLARVEGGAELTKTGSVAGTPYAMAPEQARGDTKAIGPATDVWALGVMLHECVSGRPPFEGATPLEIYDRITREEAPPLPGPLGAIAAKALRKDPAERYPDGAAFAEDLRRYAAGEPLEAKPENPVARFVRRHPVPWTLVALAVVAAFWWSERGSALRNVREKARVALEAALDLRRAGQNAAAKKYLAPLEAAAREAGGVAEVDFLLGRLYRVLQEDEKALACQERALAHPGARYERLVLLLRRHARQSAGESKPDPGLEDEIRREAKAVDALGLLALFEGRDAAKLLAEEVERHPDRTEAWEALGRATGDEAVYTKAIALDRGYVPYLFGRADVRHQRGSRKKDHGQDPLADYEAAEEDLNEALRLEPESAEALGRRGLVRTQRGVHRLQIGEDPKPDLAAAEADFTRALALDPGEMRAWIWRGSARYHGGDLAGSAADFEEAAKRRRSPDLLMRRGRLRAKLGDYEGAEEDFRASIGLDGRNVWCWQWRGQARLLAGDWAAAEAHFSQAIEIDPEHYYAWEGRGQTRWRRGRKEDVALAAADFERAMALNPRLGASLAPLLKEAREK